MKRRSVLVYVFTVLLLSTYTPVKGWTWDDTWCTVKTYGGTILAAGGAVAAAPVIISGAGFTAAGIAVGSLAAKAMAVTAVACGGGVVAGGIIATLQSAGAAGIGSSAKAVIAGVAGGTYRYFVGGCSKNDCNEK